MRDLLIFIFENILTHILCDTILLKICFLEKLMYEDYKGISWLYSTGRDLPIVFGQKQHYSAFMFYVSVFVLSVSESRGK